MAENNESDNKVLEELAIITDKIQTLLPKSKSTIIFEMDNYEFAKTKKIFSIFNDKTQRFKIEISETEIVFLNENVFFDEEPKEEETNVEKEDIKPKKFNWIRKLFFKRK